MTCTVRDHLSRVLLLSICVILLDVAAAQETDAKAEPSADPELEVDETLISPLALPDTSSPRATFKSFIDNFEATFRPFHENRTIRLPDRNHPGLSA